jgi:uncharacterized protein HemX
MTGMICSTIATYFTKNGDVIFFFMLALLVAIIHTNGGFYNHMAQPKPQTRKHVINARNKAKSSSNKRSAKKQASKIPKKYPFTRK